MNFDRIPPWSSPVRTTGSRRCQVPRDGSADPARSVQPDRMAAGRKSQPMTQSFRALLLMAAALLMTFGAVGYALVVVPDLHGDLLEIGVRPSVLGGTVLHLYFAAIAMFGFALIVLASAIQAIRVGVPARCPIA